MKRDIYKELLKWKKSPRRKPLILRGARQTGKTYILKEFGAKEYESCHYFNFEETPEVNSLFEESLKPNRIIEMLSIYSKKKILPKKHLIILDEIQESNEALIALKYFNEHASEYHIVSAGSLLGVKLSRPKSFPVGKVNFLDLYPMTFPEFLDACQESGLREFLGNYNSLNPIPKALHLELIGLLRKYYFIGGMPEAIKYYIEQNDFFEIRKIHDEILTSYQLDFAKHANRSDIPRLSLIWDNVPVQLARENKKFIFSAIKKSARSRDYEGALQWLKDAGLIYQAYETSKAELPQLGLAKSSSFKVYMADIGLLGAKVNLTQSILTQKNELFQTYHGAFVENYCATHLLISPGTGLYYWKSEGKKAELDFILEINGTLLPLEVKAGINPKSKSLASYKLQFNPPILLRTTLLNLKRNGDILNIPLYMLPFIERIQNLI
ncbi:MAG: ATP-binding protein [Bacteriovoracaceae bacterium]|nr:ATP-binding protein [Bacteriovoracaceae bacterium]